MSGHPRLTGIYIFALWVLNWIPFCFVSPPFYKAENVTVRYVVPQNTAVLPHLWLYTCLLRLLYCLREWYQEGSEPRSHDVSFEVFHWTHSVKLITFINKNKPLSKVLYFSSWTVICKWLMLLIWRDSQSILYGSYDLVIWLQNIFGNTPFLICCIWFLNVFQHFSTSLDWYYQAGDMVYSMCSMHYFSCLCIYMKVYQYWVQIIRLLHIYLNSFVVSHLSSTSQQFCA
jgi:hypothetical protein